MVDEKEKIVKEDAPTNSMGASSSSSGPIAMYDPFLKNVKRKKPLTYAQFVKGKRNSGAQ